MSQENVEVVREAVDALNARNRERLRSVFHPEVEFRSVAEQKVYRGYAGLVEYRRDVDATLDDFRTEEDRFLDADKGRVVHLYRVVARGLGSGAPVSQEMGAVHFETARSSGSTPISTSATPSKPPGCGSRRCRRRT
jgi:SnoaL-like domain